MASNRSAKAVLSPAFAAADNASASVARFAAAFSNPARSDQMAGSAFVSWPFSLPGGNRVGNCLAQPAMALALSAYGFTSSFAATARFMSPVTAPTRSWPTCRVTMTSGPGACARKSPETPSTNRPKQASNVYRIALTPCLPGRYGMAGRAVQGAPAIKNSHDTRRPGGQTGRKSKPSQVRKTMPHIRTSPCFAALIPGTTQPAGSRRRGSGRDWPRPASASSMAAGASASWARSRKRRWPREGA